MLAQDVGSGRCTHHVLSSFFLFILALVLKNVKAFVYSELDIGFLRLLVLQAINSKLLDDIISVCLAY